jgi:LCP family protein required for cell wall assembly
MHDVPRKHHSPAPKPRLSEQPRSMLNTTIPGNFPHPLLTSNHANRTKKRRRSTKKKVFLGSGLFILVLCLSVGGFLGFRGLDTLNKVFHGNIFSDAQALFSTTKLKGEDTGRVNILLAGDSADDPNHGGANLTDSIMVLSINTKDHTGFMLSIPRDLWVNIPGWSHQKINAANNVTAFSQAGYPNGGMGQLEQIIQTQLGIPIDYYALIDYSAFRDSVSAVGGITINIHSTDPRGLYDPNIGKSDGGPLKLPNGEVTLNGQTALNLARARGDSYYSYGFPASDFDRTTHQRQMLVALEQKALSLGVLTNPVRVSQLFGAFGNNIQTDLTLSDVMRGITLTKGTNVSNLQTLTLSNGGANPLLVSYLAPNGQDTFIPKAGIDDFGQIRQYYKQLTSNDPVVKEAPTAIILNGTSTTGLANKEKIVLQNKGFNVISVGDANNIYATTTVVANVTNKPASKQWLQQLLSVNAVSSASASAEAQEAQGYTADFVIILGSNTH